VHVHEAPNFRTRQQGVRVAIADTGPGIAKQFLEQIFQPFFTTKGEKGTGLGLWITRDAVEKHGGVIRVKSKLGAGSCFMFFLPQPSEVASEKVEKAS
jgi:signal transduction histidine kinase